ncbi:MAG: hypothetical protein CM1200mP13_10830 [Candidatus Pelagibacterales bacterium]|nr:MAG: hypothetical protein CM1200mP13_10830 [Pelagibacterales bacterium]
MIKDGINEGATLAAGGPELPSGLEKGYFIKPTIFTDVTNTMQIAKKEIFGPVLSIIPFETEEEAISITNETNTVLEIICKQKIKKKQKELLKN